jgi:hypothetical protein
MTAETYLQYENDTYPNQTYSFDVRHYCIDTNRSYTINTSVDCENSDNEFVPVVLGFFHSSRLDMQAELSEIIEERLDELLKNYNYKFEVWDCCDKIIDINADAQPEGREGKAKYYFDGDGYKGVMNLTVWR